MFRNSLIFDDAFWETVELIDSLEADISIKAIISQLEISEFELFRVISFLENFNYQINITQHDDDVVISPPDTKAKIQMDFTLPQWVSLQAHIPLTNEYNNKSFHDTLVIKMAEIEQRYPQYALHNVLEKEEEKQEALKGLMANESKGIAKISEALLHKYLALVELKDKKKVEVYPHRITYIDGKLNVIGESTDARCLICIDAEDVLKTKLIKTHEYSGNFSPRAIDDFIYAIRAVNGNEVRLILKIFDEAKVELNPAFHFQGNPYLTTNANGDTIWAGSVEISDNLFEWLLEIRDGAEIIDPNGLKKDFLKYCNEKLQKEKKAS